MSEELRKLVEDVKNNPEILTCDERTVEHIIITPFLRCLGWNISNANGIKYQYPIEKYKVDYALMVDSKPRVFIEVKKSGIQFDTEEKIQILKYAVYEGVELAILTNGIVWWFYLPNLKGSWEEKKFATININQQDLDGIVSKFSNYLEKGNVESGENVKKANEVYERQQKEKVVSETIPKAWEKIIGEPDELFIELIKDTTEKICGYKPDKQQIDQFLKTCKPTIPPITPKPLPQQIRKQAYGDYGNATLKQILKVIECMQDSKTYQTAVKETAAHFGVEESTIRDKCTRRLDINTDKFVKMVTDGSIENF